MPKHIPLTRGHAALVDDADYDWLSQWKWLLVGSGYAGRFHRSGGTSTLIYMHRAILGAHGDQRVDHINTNKLDNRRANLRFVTRSQNHQNRRPYPHTSSGRKGVSWHKRLGKWHVRITVNHQCLHLGYYTDLETAALLYDAAARHFFGVYARPNYPDTPTPPEIAGLLAHVLAQQATARPAVTGPTACQGRCALCRRDE
jgi:hypothetical protein